MADVYHFIVNPKSGSTPEIAAVRHLRDYLARRGDVVRLAVTRSLAHAGELAASAVSADGAGIVIAGGDGTIRSVVEAVAGAEIPLIILPCGTENLLAQELGIDGSARTTCTLVDHGRLRQLDLGQANGRCFMAIAGVGFDAEVIRRINQFRSGHITHAHYIWPICRTFWEYRFPHLRVEVDGQLLCDEPSLVFVGNIARYAVSLPILPEADCSDGLLDICIYKCRRRPRLLLHSLLTILGQSHRSGQVVRARGRHIAISSPEPDVPVQLDGDPGPSLPLSITVVPAAARVMTPPAPAHHQYCPPVRFFHLRRWLFK